MASSQNSLSNHDLSLYVGTLDDLEDLFRSIISEEMIPVVTSHSCYQDYTSYVQSEVL